MNILIIGHKYLNPIGTKLISEFKKNKFKIYFFANKAPEKVVNDYTKLGVKLIKNPNELAHEKVLVLGTKIKTLKYFKNFNKESILVFNPLFINNVKLLNEAIKYGLTIFDYEFFNKDGNYFFVEGFDQIKANFFTNKIIHIIKKQKPIKLDKKKSKVEPKQWGVKRKILVVEASSTNQEIIINMLMQGNNVILLEQNQDLYEELLKNSFFTNLAKKHNGSFKVDQNTYDNLNKYCKDSDIIVGGNLIPGHLASKSITKEMVASMPPLSIAIDTSIENGTCFENFTTPVNEKQMPKIKNNVYHYANEHYYLNDLDKVNAILEKGFSKVVNNISVNSTKYSDGLMVKNGIITSQYLQEGLNIKSK